MVKSRKQKFVLIWIVLCIILLISAGSFLIATTSSPHSTARRFIIDWPLLSAAPKKSLLFEATQISQRGFLVDNSSKMLVKNSSKSEELKPDMSHTEPIVIVQWVGGLDWLKVEGFVKNCDIPCYQTLNKNKAETASAIVFPIPSFGTGDPRSALNGGASQAKLVAFSMESQENIQRQKNLSDYDIAITYRFDSDVPVPYYGWHSNLHANTNDWPWEKREPAIVFIARNRCNYSYRDKLVTELGRYVRVDSISSCLNNRPWPKGVSRSDKDGALKRYRLYLAAENSITKDYVSEKVYDGLINGAVPLYLGAPNIEELVPPHSVIPIPGNFTTADVARIADIAKNIITNKTAYEEWIEFKKHPYEEWFKEKFSICQTHVWCRLCRKLYAMKNGLGWDKQKQEIIFN